MRQSKINSQISIHAPPRGATRPVRGIAFCTDISIHAPPRGATALYGYNVFYQPTFQFTPLREGRLVRVLRLGVRILFQFTPLREGRHELLASLRSVFDFNSRPSARGDQGCAFQQTSHYIFQFTPLREGRRKQTFRVTCKSYFNSRPSARGDLMCAPIYCETNGISIHAPPRGATAKDMQFLQIFCSTLTNQHGLTIVPRNLSRLFW